jgi:hypothetical protein
MLWFAVANTKDNVRDLVLKNGPKLALCCTSHFWHSVGGTIQQVNGTSGYPGYSFVHAYTISRTTHGVLVTPETRLKRHVYTSTWNLRDVSENKVMWDVQTLLSTGANVDGESPRPNLQTSFYEFTINPKPDRNGRTLVGLRSKMNWNAALHTTEVQNTIIPALCCMYACCPCFLVCPMSWTDTNDQGQSERGIMAWFHLKGISQRSADAMRDRLRVVLNAHLADHDAIASGTVVAPVHNAMPERLDQARPCGNTGTVYYTNHAYNPNNAIQAVPVHQSSMGGNASNAYNPNHAYNPNNAIQAVPVHQSPMGGNASNAHNPNHAYNPNDAI